MMHSEPNLIPAWLFMKSIRGMVVNSAVIDDKFVIAPAELMTRYGADIQKHNDELCKLATPLTQMRCSIMWNMAKSHVLHTIYGDAWVDARDDAEFDNPVVWDHLKARQIGIEKAIETEDFKQFGEQLWAWIDVNRQIVAIYNQKKEAA